jgi:GT2 family glycosyltransferase
VPDLSLVILSWNARDELLACVRSIEAASVGIDVEIIVVDNASSDDSPDAVEREFPNVKVIRNSKNLGFAAGNNVGIRQSAGRYVAIVNSDTMILDDGLRKIAAFMDAHPRTGIAGPRIVNEDRSLRVSCWQYPSVRNSLCLMLGCATLFPRSRFFSTAEMAYWDHDEVRNVEAITGAFMVARREALDEVGLLDEDFFFYAEDKDWCRRFSRAGWDVTFCPDVEVVHIGAASSSKDPIRFSIMHHKSNAHYWRKHHGRIGRFYYSCVVFGSHTARLILHLARYPFAGSRRSDARERAQTSFACLKWLLFGVEPKSKRL